MWFLCFMLLLEGLSALNFENYKPPVDFEEARQRPVIFEEYHQQWRKPFMQEQMRIKTAYKSSLERYEGLRSSLVEQLTLTKEVLGKCGITWWVDGGTALAVHRDGILFPWDYNADIGVFSVDAVRLPSCLLSVYGHGKPIPYRNVTFFVTVGKDMHSLAARTFHANEGYWGYVDFVVFEKIRNSKISTRLKSNHLTTMALSSLFPLEEKKFETMTVLAPNNLPAYLHSWYGNHLGVPGDKKDEWETFLQHRSSGTSLR
eukprot:m.240997 g.240997  ORF g.240997 m.240997 type:complete len:259 (-) comp16084_c0_seq3:138-914(-)